MLDSYAAAFGVHPTASGAHVNTRTAENLSAVTACVNAIASAMGSLPALCYRMAEAGRVEDPRHPVARLLRQPNPAQTWPDFIEWVMGSVLLQGNALALVATDGAGRPTGLHPVPWGQVTPVLLPTGSLAYDVAMWPTAPWGLPVGNSRGTVRRYLAGEVFHLKDRSDDGYIGRSRISRAPDVLGNALALQHWSGSLWRNGATPSGVLEMDKVLPNEAVADRIRQGVQRAIGGTHNAGRIMVLELGMKWKAISMSPEDAEVLASRRFTVEELCRLFQVPPPLIQDYTNNTFTNAAQASLWFAQYGLGPWVRKVEAEFGRSVFGAASRNTHAVELDMSGLMRGDYAARWQAHEIAVRNQILTTDEVREVEGWNPRDEINAEVITP